jgi:hypothetical protein
MPYVSIQDRVNAILTRQVAVSDDSGVSRPDIETAAILESVATTLLTHPRTALYLAHMGRNRLINLLKNEITAIEQLSETISAFNNTSFAIKDLTVLEKAKTSLIQIESQDALETKGGAYKRFDTAISVFLDKQLAKNVRSNGQFIQPGIEARLEMPGVYETLKNLHADVLEGLYALITGVDNFIESPFGTTLGLTATSRARHTLEDVIATLTTDESASASRDIAVQLITSRAALKVLGTKPNVNAPLIASTDGISARVKLSNASLNFQGPLTIPDNFMIGIGPSLTGLASGWFPLLTSDISGLPLVISTTENLGPYVIPPLGCLFIELTNATSHVPFTVTAVLNTDPVSWYGKTLVEVQTAVNSALAPYGGWCSQVGSSLAIWLTDPTIVSRITIAQNGSAADQVSVHDVLGFDAGQTGDVGVLQQNLLLLLLSQRFPAYSFVGEENGSITVTATDSTMAVSLTGYPLWGLTADTVVVGTGNTVELYNTSGVVDPTGLLSPGDFVVMGDTEALVVGVTSSEVILEALVPAYDGPVTASSSLSAMWLRLDSLLTVAYEAWTHTEYAANLDAVDRYIASLYGAPTPAQQHNAIDKLQHLAVALNQLLDVLTDDTTVLLPGAAAKEHELVNSIIATLEEKKYDRALDLLLKCQIQEVFSMDWQSVSFGGALMQAMSSVARNDFVYPNPMKDEVNTPAVSRNE